MRIRIDGGKLRRIRQLESCITLAELSRRSGVKASSIGMYERGELIGRRPDTVKKLADALGVPVTELLIVEDEAVA